MQRESSLTNVGADAFEHGYRLDSEFGQKLIKDEESIRQNLRVAQMYRQVNDSYQKCKEELRANLNNQEFFFAGKKARIKDKPDEFLLEQRREEYHAKKSKEEQNQSLEEKILNLLAKSPEDISKIKKQVRSILRGVAYFGTLGVGAWGLANNGMQAILNGSTAGLETSLAVCSILTAVPLGQIGLKKIKDIIEEHKIQNRLEADKTREEQVIEKSGDLLRQQFVRRVRIPEKTIDPIGKVVEEQLEKFERKQELPVRTPKIEKLRDALTTREKNKQKYFVQKAPILEEIAMLNKKVSNGEITERQAAERRRELAKRLKEIDDAERKEFEVALKRGRNNENR